MDSINRLGMAGGLGSIGAGLGSIFGGNDAYNDASRTYQQIPGATQQYYNPYMQAGAGALHNLQDQYGQLTGGLPGLQDQYRQMTNDPNAIMNRIGSGYQQSPGYQWQLNQGMNAANNAAAAGGMLGSPQHQQQASTMANGLANQDYYNYMQKGLGLYGAGLQGQQGLYNQGLAGQQGLNNQGFNANDQMARIMADSMGQQAQMNFAGNQAQSQGWGDLFGGLGSLAAFGGLFG